MSGMAVSPSVMAAFVSSVEPEDAVTRVTLEPGDPFARLAGAELVVRLELAAGLNQAGLTALLARLNERWSQSEIVATRVDSLEIKLVTAPRPA